LKILWEFLHDVNDRGMAAQKEWDAWLKALPYKYPQAPSFHTIAGFPRVKEWEEKYLGTKELEKYRKSTGIAHGKGVAELVEERQHLVDAEQGGRAGDRLGEVAHQGGEGDHAFALS
jgi:hypothetical protein